MSVLVKCVGGYIFILNYRSIKQDRGYLFVGGELTRCGMGERETFHFMSFYLLFLNHVIIFKIF